MQKSLYGLQKAGERALLCRINWGEFYYTIRRRAGAAKANQAIHLLEQLPVDFVEVDPALVKAAAEIKSEHPVSYADAFCVATAARYDATILTNDPEFRSISDIVKIHWLNS